MRRVGLILAQARGYALEFVDFRTDADALGQRVFQEQLVATTAAVRWLAPISAVATLSLTILFWSIAYKPLLFCAEVIDLACGAWTWVVLPGVVATVANQRLARTHAILATTHGVAWALVTLALLPHANGPHVEMLVACLQLAMVSIALVMYVNLPAAIPLFAVPSLVPLILTFAEAHDRTVIGVPLAVIFILIVARVGVDQNRMFVRSARLGDALGAEIGRTEAERRAIAEAQAREAECRAAETRAAAAQRRDQMLALAERFEREVLDAAAAQADAMATMQRSAGELDRIIGASATTSDLVSQRSAVTAGAVAALAAAVDELSVAIAAIAARIGDHATLSDRARRAASDSAGRIATMAEATGQIDAMVALIQGMTKQTTLLSLNATIEAARAGDAGRGFAVVASEVKSLAEQSGKAAQDITLQVGGIAQRIDTAMASIRDTAGEIDHVAAIAAAMAQSIDEQRRATQEIGEESGTVAREVEGVRGQVAELASSARSAGALTAAVNETASRVAGRALDLRTATNVFLRDLRAA